MKRAAICLCFLFCAAGLRAFDLQYGSLFWVTGISLEEGNLVMPVTREKYANVRVLDKDTFEFLKTCQAVCEQKDAFGRVRVSQLRAAKTRPGMWIGDVVVDDKWQLTFLVFEKKGQFSVVPPAPVKVQDVIWLKQVEDLLKARVQEEK